VPLHTSAGEIAGPDVLVHPGDMTIVGDTVRPFGVELVSIETAEDHA
jgi:hypothetical protein